MKKEWFSSTELIAIDGLPSTVQGINQKARRENWTLRKKSGVQGKAVEYHVDNFSEGVKRQLMLSENNTSYEVFSGDIKYVWMEIFYQLKDDERTFLTNWLLRNGVSALLTSIKNYSDNNEKDSV